MFRPICTRGASQLRRVLNGPGVVNVRNFWLRPWSETRSLVPFDRQLDRWFRQVEHEMDRAYDHFWDRTPFRAPRILGRDVPVQVTGDGSGQISLKVDVSQFVPEEVKVTVLNGLLTIRARHEETSSDGGKAYRESVTEYSLPADVNEESIRSVLGKDGILTIEAIVPKTEGAKETEIPIQKDEASDKN